MTEFDRQGRDHFYRILEPWPGMVMAYATAAKIEAKLASIPYPVARAKLVALRAAMEAARRDMRGVETRTAAFADEAIKRRIRATMRRPHNTGKLEGGIVSRPLASPFPAGQVGIADIDILDRRVVGSSNSGRHPGTAGRQPYWQVQERGSTHLVGRRVVGLYQPGNAPPNPKVFRQHARFQPGQGYAMVVKRPIEARYFLREGADDAEKYRYRATVEATAKAVRAVDSVRTLGRR